MLLNKLFMMSKENLVHMRMYAARFYNMHPKSRIFKVFAEKIARRLEKSPPDG